jgi:adenosylcobinamide-GDP ribazoletransferase
VKGLVIAIQFLTRLPMPRFPATSEEFAASMRWFPAVGLIVGAIVAGGGWAGARIDPWTGAIVALLLWVAVTGGLHLDGLGDIADANGAAHKDRERLLAVLADPHVGSFGVVAIALQLLCKLVLLHGLLERGWFVSLALVPFAARLGPLVWTRWLPSLHDGLGAKFRDVIRPADLVLWSAGLLLVAWFVPALLVVVAFIALWGWWIGRRIGGISGDGHGAGIEIGETVLLFALVAEAALA